MINTRIKNRAGSRKRQFRTSSVSNKTMTIPRLKKLTRPVFKKTGVIKALLFGSFASTEDRRSDIDMFIIKKTAKRFLDRFDEFSELYLLLGKQGVDLLIYSPEEVERNSHRPFIKTILSEGVTIYER